MKKLIVGAALIAALGLSACAELPEEPAAAPATKAEQKADRKAQRKQREAAKPKAEKASTETREQENARGSAENYLDFQAFSRKGLIKQLKFEGYSEAVARYAVDAVSPNWNKQAVKSAKQYLDQQQFSRSSLQQQLEFEGFTPAQAAYGVQQAY